MHTKLGLRLALGCLLVLSACSGDDKGQKNADAGTTTDGGARDGAAGGGGQGTGSDGEGKQCKEDGDCGSGLRCLKADARDDSLKVCARPCKDDGECEQGERCLAATGAPADALCWSVASEALKPCGPAFTSMCDPDANLGCLRVEADDGSVAGGVCLTPCKLPGQDEANPCSDGLTCLDLIAKEGEGVCAHQVDRGEVCDEPKGNFCGSGDFCLSDGTEWRCYQDCTDSKKCDGDKQCKALKDDQGSYCD